MGTNVHVQKGGVGISPLVYHAAVATDGAGKTVTLNPATSKVALDHLNDVAVPIFCAFGRSASDAISNLNIAAAAATTGIRILNTTNARSFIILSVPVNATHLAYATATAANTPSIIVTEGV